MQEGALELCSFHSFGLGVQLQLEAFVLYFIHSLRR